ncbi:LysM peptidoglycan-binding domain-containing protein [Faecalimonas sp.]
MERKIPKNVRQIGNVSDSLKIYVEDYVDTYLNQLCEKEAENPVGAFLIGDIVKEEELEYQYIYGAIQMEELRQNENGIFVDEETWENACEVCRTFFENGEIIGWFAAIPGIPFAMNGNLRKVHQDIFAKNKGIFILKDPVCKDEMYFAPKFNDLMQMNGHYIYYEKNPSMQNYMISSRKKIGVTPSEIVVDRAAKSFRDLVQSKMLQQEKKEVNKWAYGTVTFLILVVLIIGVTMINNYDRMKSVQKAIETISNSVEEKKTTNKKEKQEKKIEKKEKEEKNIYIVEKGDTLEKISKKAYGDIQHIEEISETNGLENGNLIYIGQKLLLP